MVYFVLVLIILVLLYFASKAFLENSRYRNTLDGEIQEVRKDGTTTISHYRKGVRYGEYKVLDKNGNIKLMQNYNSNGKLDGPAMEYNYNGILISEGLWKDDSKVGVWKTYFGDGKQESIHHYDDNSNSISSMAYYENGQLWFESRDNFENSYYKNGVLKRRIVFRTKWRQMYDLSYYKENYENSNLKEERVYKYENLDECYRTLYYENGILKEEGRAKVGQHRIDCLGTWKIYDKNGNLYNTIKYT